MKNPFAYGRALSPEDAHIARPELDRHLRDIATRHGRIVLLGDRRVGKSSAVPLALAGCPLITIDCYGCRNTADFLERARFALASTEHVLPELWAKLRDSIHGFTLSNAALELHGSITHGTVTSLMQALDRFGHSAPNAVVFFDEFQDLLTAGPKEEARSLLGLMRGQIQRHNRTAYIFAGSAKKEMPAMFLGHGAPFYKAADIFDVKPIPRDDMMQFLAHNFGRTRRKLAPETALAIMSIGGDSPNDIQQLASYVWGEGVEGQTMTLSHVRSGLNLLLDHQDRFVTAILSDATAIQERVLFAIACKGTAAVSAREFLVTVGVSSRNTAASAARRFCTGDDAILCQEDGRYMFRDRFTYLGLLRRIIRHPITLRILNLDTSFTPDNTLKQLLGHPSEVLIEDVLPPERTMRRKL